ncbi:hypothetical protein COY00_01870 [Candidatus Pacearchaeota archaeon CG_4_10_14_0_2_um_filter_35_33]|nr:MAG: hypothetical protein COY79_03225 [Candidatus Pacearchaeota archaeon CG_4_10_14_0_8_um_filter_35_169]PIZ80197.1 MAG: hypothetical protein COY00_01870 [Candidatus Pacearchaeota archaeon CG_4_10_14_0_2_um_filter_35_33]PJA69538.1 MAG: hypothetical protein CO155_04675 [Candidatus Pacearchaeota archaeon CG_4_9_14_3_um_filter_35_19]
MKLDKKKELAVRTLKVGKARIVFNINRLDEIKEAITKQDIRDLVSSGAIKVNEIKGRKTKRKRKTRRRIGSVKIKVNTRKRDYMTITRKLRSYLLDLKKRNAIPADVYKQMRKEIRLSSFKSLAQMKDRIAKIRREN